MKKKIIMGICMLMLLVGCNYPTDNYIYHTYEIEPRENGLCYCTPDLYSRYNCSHCSLGWVINHTNEKCICKYTKCNEPMECKLKDRY